MEQVHRHQLSSYVCKACLKEANVVHHLRLDPDKMAQAVKNHIVLPLYCPKCSHEATVVVSLLEH